MQNHTQQNSLSVREVKASPRKTFGPKELLTKPPFSVAKEMRQMKTNTLVLTAASQPNYYRVLWYVRGVTMSAMDIKKLFAKAQALLVLAAYLELDLHIVFPNLSGSQLL